jgi:hypothetical protein
VKSRGEVLTATFLICATLFSCRKGNGLARPALTFFSHRIETFSGVDSEKNLGSENATVTKSQGFHVVNHSSSMGLFMLHAILEMSLAGFSYLPLRAFPE